MPEIIPNYHPLFVHFTIALITTSLVTLILGWIFTPWKTARKECFIVSRWCLWLGALASIITIAAGFQAYATVAHDTVSHRVMNIHRIWGIATFVLIWVMTIWSWVLLIKRRNPKWLFTLGMIIIFGFVVTTGWYGTELVYRYGTGVLSLPKTRSTSPSPIQANASETDNHGQHEH